MKPSSRDDSIKLELLLVAAVLEPVTTPSQNASPYFCRKTSLRSARGSATPSSRSVKSMEVTKPSNVVTKRVRPPVAGVLELPIPPPQEMSVIIDLDGLTWHLKRGLGVPLTQTVKNPSLSPHARMVV